MLKRIKEILYRSFDTNEISYKKMQEIIKNDKTCVILDVRSKQEYMEGHLDNAINIPLYDLEKGIYNLPNKECKTIIYCTSGYRSRQAKEKLESLGYKNVYNLKDGLDGI